MCVADAALMTFNKVDMARRPHPQQHLANVIKIEYRYAEINSGQNWVILLLFEIHLFVSYIICVLNRKILSLS